MNANLFQEKVNQLKKNERLRYWCEYLKLLKLFYKEIWEQSACRFFYKKKKHKSEMNLKLTQKYYIEREHKDAWNLSSGDEWCTINPEL